MSFAYVSIRLYVFIDFLKLFIYSENAFVRHFYKYTCSVVFFLPLMAPPIFTQSSQIIVYLLDQFISKDTYLLFHSYLRILQKCVGSGN